MRLHRRTPDPSRGGFSAPELAFSTTIFVVVLLSSLAMVNRDTHLAKSTLGIGTVENLAQEMLFELEHELANARGEVPEALLTAPLGGGATAGMQLDSTLGFPDQGTVIVSRGTGSEERIRYDSFLASQNGLTGLTRGLGCTADGSHPNKAEVHWQGLGLVLAQQAPAPPASDFDGRALEPDGPRFFLGDGSGFSYRVPVDPADPVDGTNYLNGDSLFWGGVIDPANDPRDCWVSLYFEPKTVLSEAGTGDDLNRDGDLGDVFDVGQIRRRVWNAADPAAPVRDLGLGPSAVLQERCNWGGDLNGDGFDDPIFLWDENTRRLHVRVTVVGTSVADMPLVRTVESVVFLRNEPSS